MKVLLVEDENVTRGLLRNHLKSWGFEPVECVDGLKGWDTYQKLTPKIAIVDWMMPGMDGLELCRRIKALNTSSFTYTIMLTAKTEKADVVDGLDGGADDYLTKPFDPAELRARLRKAVSRVRLSEEKDQVIKEKESIRRRHQILTSVVSRMFRPDFDGFVGEYEGTSDLALRELGPVSDFSKLFASCLNQMGIIVQEIESPLVWSPELTARAFLMVPQRERWLDLRFDLSMKSARELYDAGGFEGEPVQHDLEDWICEILNVVRGAMKRMFDAAGIRAFTPFVPYAGDSKSMHFCGDATKEHYFSFKGGSGRVTLSECPASPVQKSSSELRRMDVLTDAVRSGDHSLAMAGTNLEEHHLQTIRRELGRVPDHLVHVVEPPPVLYADILARTFF